jgi:hypothetical protein
MESVDPDYCIEAHHMAYSKSNSGEFPDKDDMIYGMFIDNNPNHFVYMGYVRWTS